MYNNHFAVHLKLTKHCKSTIHQLKKRKKLNQEGEIYPENYKTLMKETERKSIRH